MDNSSQSPIVSGFKFSTAGGSKFLVIIIVVIIAAAAGFWFLSQRKAQGPGAPGVEAGDGLGAEALNKTKNPLANELPETNPFGVNTNPFKEQTNPFNKTYQNPFK